MYDGAHPDSWLRDRWFSVLCWSVKNDLSRDLLSPSMSSLQPDDDDSDESEEVSALPTDTWDFKRALIFEH